MKRDRRAVDLEQALHRILTRQGCTEPGNVSVSVADEATEPHYVVIVDLDTARIIARFLVHPPQLGINSNPAIWNHRFTPGARHRRGRPRRLVPAQAR